MSSLILRKLRSARSLLIQEFNRWRQRADEGGKKRQFDSWRRRLEASPPQVLIGSNFAEYGGVREHIHAIQRYSRVRVELAPPDELLLRLAPHELRTQFKEAFFDIQPTGIEALHSHVFPWFIEWCLTRKNRKAKWIHTYHLPYFAEHATGSLSGWQREINDALNEKARYADVRLSVSRWQQEFLASEHGITSSYLPNGVDVVRCDGASSERFSNETGLRAFALYVGRNDPVKNPAEFVRLAGAMPGLQCVMIGRGLTNEVLRSEWGLEVPANVFVYGEASHAVVQDAIAASSVVVVTSKREGLPTLVLEAMTAGKSVVVPREAGCLEAIDHGRFGFVYEAGRVDDLAHQTENAINDSNRCSLARERILAEYDWRVVAPKLDAIYKD